MSGSTGNRLKEGARSAANRLEGAAKDAVENPMQAKRDLLHHPYTRVALPFLNGGLAGMAATTCIQPVDMIKVRLQSAGEGVRTGPKPTPLSVTREILASG